jgi:hypothetical protein
MSSELPLVLLGAGLLTAGYFLVADNEVAQTQEQQANEETTTRTGVPHRSHGHVFVWVHSSGSYGSGSRVASPSSISSSGRGGFGGSSSFFSGGGGS